MSDRFERSTNWSERTGARYWWHRLPGMKFTPSVYSDLTDAEWEVIRDWYDETDRTGDIGECVVPLISLLHGIVLGNGASRIVQLGTCSGYSALLIGFMLRRMNATHGLFTLEIGPHLCELSGRWLARAALNDFVKVAELNSLDPAAPARALDYLGGRPEIVIIDSSHEYGATLREIEVWYSTLEQGGIVLLHDVSIFATQFDVTKQGGVRRALDEWRRANPDSETFSLNGNARTMDLPRPFYKDACGVGLIHKPLA